jgi:hypothetical protein
LPLPREPTMDVGGRGREGCWRRSHAARLGPSIAMDLWLARG